MIQLRRLNGTPFWLNAELIEQIETAPDTVITLTTGNNIVVRERVEEIVELILAYRGRIQAEKESRLAVAGRKGA
jgi:flagellar protein FlbD